MVNGNVEAVFSYKLITKNYDRDPDTVEYIKEAKEKGDKYYQIYYDEYLKPQESNFYFKAVIDENDYITLYTRNVAIESEEWHQVEISDYIIKKTNGTDITENSETNGNTDDYDYDITNPVEVVSADYMSWLKEDYTISMNVLKAEVDDAETQRHIKSYKGSELAETRGWTDEYLDQHFIVVKVIYECELDHNKTFMNDGLLEGYVFLTRDPECGAWTICDRTSPSEAL